MKRIIILLALVLSFVAVQGGELHANKFNDNKIFPDWTQDKKPKGVIGENGGEIKKLNEKGKNQGLLLFFPKIINYALFSISAVAVIAIIWAGIKLLIAQGSDENHEKSKKVFQYAIIGFLFAVAAYTLVRVTYEILTDKT